MATGHNIDLELLALASQLVIHIQTVKLPAVESIIRFFSYFTILTNLLIAIFVGVLLAGSTGRVYAFFSKSSIQAAITLYIKVVGVIYNLVLRNLWDSSGLQAILHDILHTLVPILMIIYWYSYAPKRRLEYNNVPLWLLYPAIYTIIVILRGTTANWYPYPFFDLDKSTQTQIMTNCALLLLVFLVFGLILVFAGRRTSSHRG